MQAPQEDHSVRHLVAVALVLAALSTPALCPEAPLLAEIPQERLERNLATSPQEVLSLMRRHPGALRPPHAEAIARAVAEASNRRGLAPELLLAVIGAESSFRWGAVSHKGAVGLMQLMPGTAEEVATRMEMPWTGKGLLEDPEANIALGAFYLGFLLDSFGDLDRALAGYNRGPNGLPVGGGIPSSGETADYVRRVHQLLDMQGIHGRPDLMGDPNPFGGAADPGL
jgi:soluble lytic murein transglycosylase-like protein